MPTCAIVPVPPWTGQPSPVCPITTAQNKTYARGALSCLQVSKRSRWQCILERRGMAWVPPGGQEIACDSHRLRNVHLDGHKDLHRHPRTTGPAPAVRIWVTPRTWMPLMRPVLGTASAWAAALTAAGKGKQVHQFSPVSPWWTAPGKRQLRGVCTFSVF